MQQQFCSVYTAVVRFTPSVFKPWSNEGLINDERDHVLLFTVGWPITFSGLALSCQERPPLVPRHKQKTLCILPAHFSKVPSVEEESHASQEEDNKIHYE
jgi:hypothetical protein